MNCVLSDTKRFKQVNYDNNIHNLDKFQKCLYYLKRKGSLEQEIYDRIKPSAAVTPTLYGLPKIHKENCPCHPVLASTDCYTYECALWLSEILSPLRQHPTNLKDTFEFVDRMQQVKFKNNSVMVSFDVKSLFTNIPVDFVTDIILKEIYGSDSTKKVYGLTKRQFKNLLVWTTKRPTLNFNGSFYEQIDGVGMGSPIAPAFADIFMNYVIEKTKEFNMQPDVFFRYVADCFAVFPDFESAMLFYRKLNQIHSNVNFTYDKQLPFLDVNVDNSKDKLELSIYRKPTHTGLYNKWSSLAPTKYKINLIRSLVNRAIKVCSNRQLLFLECEKITKMLQQNEYPTKTIRNVIRKAINRNQKPDAKLYPNQQQSTKHCVFFKLQFIDRISMQIEKEIREFLCPYDIKWIMSHRNFTIGKLFPYKDRQSLLHSSGVVYQLTCSCGQNYIGQTKRNLITRLNEHRTCEDSGVCKHLLNNPNHVINFDSPKILDRSNHVTKLRIKETLHISKTEPQLNVDNQSLPLYLFNA